MKRDLERIEVPDEHGARERAWLVVESAFVEREPVARRPRRVRAVLVTAVLAALVAAALSPPGRAVLDEIREVVGVQRAQPALFSLPAPGKLLVSSDAGIWVVQRDGSKRLLGDYREASWSPFGRFIVATRANELAALEPDGDVRWTLARPGVTSPRWTGTESDTRIAYVDRTGLRVVAGDGSGDRLLVPRARGPLAWKPGSAFVLAHTTAGGRAGAEHPTPGRCSGEPGARQGALPGSTGQRTGSACSFFRRATSVCTTTEVGSSSRRIPQRGGRTSTPPSTRDRMTPQSPVCTGRRAPCTS